MCEWYSCEGVCVYACVCEWYSCEGVCVCVCEWGGLRGVCEWRGCEVCVCV